jgi:hypothetical protein
VTRIGLRQTADRYLTRSTEAVAAMQRDRIGFIQLARFLTRIEMETQ